MSHRTENRSWKRRTTATLMFALRLFAPAVSGFMISLLVVQLFSKELWGSVANISLWVFLLSGIASWGSKDFLLRQFSREPSAITRVFTASLITRALMLPVLAALLFILTEADVTIWILCSAWLAARFIFTSFEPLVIFHKKFGLMAALEITGALVVAAIILLRGRPSEVADIIMFLLLADLLKAMLLCVIFSKSIMFRSTPLISSNHIIGALPFFLIGIAGLLHSRLEQIIVNMCLADGEKALCQVYMSLLLAAMTIPALLITPLTKNLYRSKVEIFRKIRSWLLRIGAAAAPLSGILIWIIVRFLYGFDTGYPILAAGILFCIPSYFYIPAMYESYKQGRQTRILIRVILCFATGCISGFFIIPIWQTTGAIFNAAFTQWLMMILLMDKPKQASQPLNGSNYSEFQLIEPER